MRKSLRGCSQAQGENEREGAVWGRGLGLVLPGPHWALTSQGLFGRLCSRWPWKALMLGRLRQPRLLPSSPSPLTRR